jgi:predicted AAA+ superfamily ATPase
LERPDYETVKREVESSDIVIFVGPSNCGKSTTVRRVIAGRKGTVFISLRELDDNVGYVFAKKFGCDVHLYSEFNAPQGLIRELIKDALQELKQENGPSVVVVLDDVHIAIDREHKLFKSVDFKNVMIWLLEMHSEGLLTFKMLTSERNIISTLRQLPGFAGRLTVHEMDYVPTDTIANYLRSNFKGITQHDADCVTRTIGGHLGDLRKVIYALALHEPNPMCNTVQEAISALIKSDTIIMRDVLKGVIAPPSYSKKTFTRAVHQIFQSLTENEHHKVSRSDVRRKVGISVEEMDKIVEFLEDLHLIVDIDGVKVTFHAPRQVQAYLMLKDEIDVQEALSEALQ